MAEIILSNGKIALVDDHVYDALMAGGWKHWHYHHGGYAIIRNPDYKDTQVIKGTAEPYWLRMHVLIAGRPTRSKVLHKNGNKLDNRLENLQVVSLQTKYRGVYRRHNGLPWGARVWATDPYGNRYWAVAKGGFATPEEAAREYDRMAIFHQGKRARLNFPDDE